MKAQVLIIVVLLISCASEQGQRTWTRRISEVRYYNAKDTRIAECASGDSLNMEAIESSRQIICLIDSLSHLIPLLTSEFPRTEKNMGVGNSLVSLKSTDGKIHYCLYHPETGVFRKFNGRTFETALTVADTTLRRELIDKMNRCGSFLLRQTKSEKIKRQFAPHWKSRKL